MPITKKDISRKCRIKGIKLEQTASPRKKISLDYPVFAIADVEGSRVFIYDPMSEIDDMWSVPKEMIILLKE